ncbi:phosphate signaling complex protein PhoU [Anaerofilum sp. BX8]|uniref:Phosphate-specific transport system accessory protein PhoU n=1 Tax=Anaerofilum hominis TaxID=2763016 RepID=A0A923L112_9FIRM|nr:phosphate signaling complex protein PhoU [Anaerofilum hominis]MBC5581227.1 phosphate signaling complex protein PhoU [Anaerofilum hominis]
MSVRKTFDAELAELSASLIRMGSEAAGAIDNAIRAFDSHDLQLAGAVIQGDRRVDDMEREIERHCLTLLLRQQPVARDLRIISTALKMITDIERIGDAAADIAEITRHISGEIPELLVLIDSMAAEARSMVSDAVDAFVASDMEKAEKVILRDDIVDGAFNSVKGKMVEVLRRDSSLVDVAIDYLMIAKYLERLGDHAVNICEWTEFYKTGVHQTGR